MKSNIKDTSKWENLFSLRSDIKTDDILSSEANLTTERDIKNLFNSLYEKISKGATLVKQDGEWFLETVDLELHPLRSAQIEHLLLVIDDSSKAYLNLSPITANYSSYLSLIRTVQDFPKPGILFYDWMPIMLNSIAFQRLIRDLATTVKDFNFTKIVALESRGFLLGVPLSTYFGVPFVPIRKKGKLPGEVISQTYSLEYGVDEIEIQKDTITKEDSVLIVDDLLATGGTIKAANQLVSKFTNSIQDLFFIELKNLRGNWLIEYPYKSLVKK